MSTIQKESKKEDACMKVYVTPKYIEERIRHLEMFADETKFKFLARKDKEVARDEIKNLQIFSQKLASGLLTWHRGWNFNFPQSFPSNNDKGDSKPVDYFFFNGGENFVKMIN
jgi:hypothetical protein